MDPEAEGLLDDVTVSPKAEDLMLECAELEIEDYSPMEKYFKEPCNDSDDQDEMISDVLQQLVKVEEVEWHPVIDDGNLNFPPQVPDQIEVPVAGSLNSKSRCQRCEDDSSDDLYAESTTVTCCQSRCNKKVSKRVALDHRNSFRKLTKNEQDCMILSFLQSQVRIPELSAYYYQETKRGEARRRSCSSEISHDPIKYYFSGLTVCKNFYCFIHDIGARRFKNLRQHYLEEGVKPRRHGNAGKPSHNSKLAVEDNQFTYCAVRRTQREKTKKT